MDHGLGKQKEDAVLGLDNRASCVTPSHPEERSDRQLRHLEQRALLTGGVCAEVQASDGEYASTRVRKAIALFQQWIANEFGLPDADGIRFDHGLDALHAATDVEAMIREIRAGATVCHAVQLFWWADSSMESARDAEHVVEDLVTYFAARSNPWNR